MARSRIFPLISLILSCCVLMNGCHKTVQRPVQPVGLSPWQIIFPLGYVTTCSKDLASPKLVKGSVKRATGIGTWMDDGVAMGCAEAIPITGGLSVIPIVAYMAYVPAAAAVGAIAGKSAEKKWQPCIQELAPEIAKVDPATVLQSKLAEELNKFRDAKTVALPLEGDPFQTATQRGLKSFLQADIQDIEIKECREKRLFCLQVSLRAQLWKVPQKILFLDKVLIYVSSMEAKPDPSEIQVIGSSPCHRMEDYCGAPGKQLFGEELTAAIDSLVKRLSLELGL